MVRSTRLVPPDWSKPPVFLSWPEAAPAAGGGVWQREPRQHLPRSTSTSIIMGHDSCVLEFLSLSQCSFFQLVGNSRPENVQQYVWGREPRQHTTVAHHQHRPPTSQEATALTPTCDLLIAARIPDAGRSQSGEFRTSSNTQCGEGSR